jgi:hypothetical protein
MGKDGKDQIQRYLGAYRKRFPLIPVLAIREFLVKLNRTGKKAELN